MQQIIKVLLSIITRDISDSLPMDDDFLTLKVFAAELLFFVI